MADDNTPRSQPPRRPPVRMGLRVVARHSGGPLRRPALAHAVAQSHRPNI